MSKLRIQQYMDKHKLTPLFEEMMNKVLHDQPEDPIVYLIKNLYRKAGLAIPKDLKPGTLRRSSPERIGRRNKSPDKTTTQAWAVASGPELVDRSYDKPWQAPSKRTKSATKTDDRPTSPPKQGRKHKSEWVGDTKVTTTTFDDLFEGERSRSEPQRSESAQRQRREENPDIKKAWSKNIGLEDSEDANYRSRGYRGPRCHRDEDDPLAGEIMLAEQDTQEVEQETSRTSKCQSAKLDAKKHRQNLEKILNESDRVSLDSGFDGEKYVEEETEDDAIELLEDPEDLMREGVTNIPKSGYKLSRMLKQRQEEANVKLNINLFTGSGSPVSDFMGNRYGDYYESDLERPPTGMSFQSNKFSEYSPQMSDEEFESVSQVAGPTKPVWGPPDQDTDTYRPEVSKTLPQPAPRKTQKGKLSATVPVRFDPQAPQTRSLDNDNIFLQGSKTWTPGTDREIQHRTVTASPSALRESALRESVQSSRSQDGGGWNIPDDTEVSLATDWTEGLSTGRPNKGPPKAY